MSGDSLDKTYKKSLEVLRNLSTEKGFFASKNDLQNYKRVWARDGVVIGLACLMTGDKELIKTFRNHLYYLKSFQDKTGRIPSNVDLGGKNVSYGTLVGKIDATLWYVIGVCKYYFETKDEAFLEDFKNSLKKCFFYLEVIELNGKGLLYIPTGGDWADEFITHGYVLFDQLLYFQATKYYERIFKKINNKKLQKEFSKKKNELKRLINVNYLPKSYKLNDAFVYNKRLYEFILEEFNDDYALSYFSSDGFSKHLDGFANSLLLNMDVCLKKDLLKIERYLMRKLRNQKVKILPAFWPPITKKEKYLWNALKTNSLFEFKNKPHFYHNGGLWPVIQGFFISGLSDLKKKKYYLNEFSKSLKKDNYEFHEYYESINFTAKGIKDIGYTASGYVIAYLSTLKNKRVF